MKPTIILFKETEKPRKTIKDLETGDCFKFVDHDGLFQKTDEGRIVNLRKGVLLYEEDTYPPIEEVEATITYEVIKDAP